MPDWTKVRPSAPAPETFAAEPEFETEDIAAEPTDDGISPAALAGGAAVGAGALYGASKLAKLPGVLGKIGKGAAYANAIRQQLMLSGFAPLKSILGNIGTGVEQAAEGRGFGALKEILSPRTAREAVQAMRTPAALGRNPVGGAETVELPTLLSLPGRFMGGADEATRAALQRAGLSTKQAESAVLQTPLPENFGKMGEVLESPAARYLHPFRRTPFNQFIEGLRRLPGGSAGTAGAKALYMGAGGLHGAATAEEQYPLSVPLGVAASGRYGLPYGVAALLGRGLASGKGGGGVVGSVLPVSEYGYEQSLLKPLDPFLEPAALRAFERLGK
jgi:hypothetical protein